jgi:hypothetical protein
LSYYRLKRGKHHTFRRPVATAISSVGEEVSRLH